MYPFNDMVIQAGLAKRQDPAWFTNQATEYWERFVGTDGPPSGMESHGFPKYIPYEGSNTLGQYASGVFEMSSAIQFPFFTTKGIHTNPFYKEISQSWLNGKISCLII